MCGCDSPPPFSVAYVKYHTTTAGFAIVAQVSISSAQPPSREMPGEYTISVFVTPLQKSYSCLPLALLQYLNKNLKKKKKIKFCKHAYLVSLLNLHKQFLFHYSEMCRPHSSFKNYVCKSCTVYSANFHWISK